MEKPYIIRLGEAPDGVWMWSVLDSGEYRVRVIQQGWKQTLPDAYTAAQNHIKELKS